MKLTINTKHLQDSESIYGYIEYRIGFSFSRIRQKIRSVSINLSDINGPKGGVDKQCKMIMESENAETIVITERQSTIKQAIDRCVARASRNFNQKIKRNQILGTRRISHHSLPLLAEEI